MMPARAAPCQSIAPRQGLYDLDVVECSLCHATHDDTAPTPAGSEQYQFCGTCHADQSARIDDHNAITCIGCHKLHNSIPAGLFYGLTIEGTCTRCHGISERPLPDSLSYATVGGGSVNVPEGHNFGSACQGCHEVHKP